MTVRTLATLLAAFFAIASTGDGRADDAPASKDSTEKAQRRRRPRRAAEEESNPYGGNGEEEATDRPSRSRRGQEESAEEDAPEASAEESPPPSGGSGAAQNHGTAGGGDSLQRSDRLDFDERLIQGQTARAGAVYLFSRPPRDLPELVKLRRSFRSEISRTLLARDPIEPPHGETRPAQPAAASTAAPAHTPAPPTKAPSTTSPTPTRPGRGSRHSP